MSRSSNEVAHPRDVSLWPLARHLVLTGSAPGAVLGFGWIFCAVNGANGSLFAKLLAILVVGVLGAFFVHESGHLLSLRATSPDAVACWEITLLRISLLVRNTSSPLAVSLNAAAGPLGSAVAGCAILVAQRRFPYSLAGTVQLIGWLYLAHILFLIPPSTDGRTVLFGLRKHRELG